MARRERRARLRDLLRVDRDLRKAEERLSKLLVESNPHYPSLSKSLQGLLLRITADRVQIKSIWEDMGFKWPRKPQSYL